MIQTLEMQETYLKTAQPLITLKVNLVMFQNQNVHLKHFQRKKCLQTHRVSLHVTQTTEKFLNQINLVILSLKQQLNK